MCCLFVELTFCVEFADIMFNILLVICFLFQLPCVEFAGVIFDVLLLSCFNIFCVEFAEVNFNVLLASCFNMFCVDFSGLILSSVSSRQFGSLW